MIVYREQRRCRLTAEFLRQIENAQGLDRQMKFGQFEAWRRWPGSFAVLDEGPPRTSRFWEIACGRPLAHVYIDDRAVCLDGIFGKTLDLVCRFKAHWE